MSPVVHSAPLSSSVVSTCTQYMGTVPRVNEDRTRHLVVVCHMWMLTEPIAPRSQPPRATPTLGKATQAPLRPGDAPHASVGAVRPLRLGPGVPATGACSSKFFTDKNDSQLWLSNTLPRTSHTDGRSHADKSAFKSGEAICAFVSSSQQSPSHIQKKNPEARWFWFTVASSVDTGLHQ